MCLWLLWYDLCFLMCTVDIFGGMHALCGAGVGSWYVALFCWWLTCYGNHHVCAACFCNWHVVWIVGVWHVIWCKLSVCFDCMCSLRVASASCMVCLCIAVDVIAVDVIAGVWHISLTCTRVLPCCHVYLWCFMLCMCCDWHVGLWFVLIFCFVICLNVFVMLC